HQLEYKLFHPLPPSVPGPYASPLERGRKEGGNPSISLPGRKIFFFAEKFRSKHLDVEESEPETGSVSSGVSEWTLIRLAKGWS
ncbi:MAG: hypothetical protein ABSH41_30100, partial [Syntrophobacteraceae bacterium]